MRTRAAQVCGLLVVLLLAGCGNAATSLLYDGIGAQMHKPDTFDRALAAEKFFGLMCQRAGVRTMAHPDGFTGCEYQSMTQLDWRRVVHAGLDDIDERCDQYIESLTSARRDRDAFTRQLKDINTTTVAIVALSGTASAVAVAVLQTAFGLAEKSLDTYYSRLLLTLEPTTVHGIVRKQQTNYRNSLASGYIKHVANKPTAYYAIRGYLRLCLPSTIESEVNAAITDVHYQGDGERNIRAGTNPDLEALSVLPRTPTSATEKVERWTPKVKPGGGPGPGGEPGTDGPRPAEIGGAVGEEKGFSRDDGMTVQRKLCVEATGDFGALDSKSPTRLAIRQFEAATTRTVNSQLSAVEFREIRDGADCNPSAYLSAYEKVKFPTDAKIKELQKHIKDAFRASGRRDLAALVEPVTFESGLLDRSTRDAFKRIHDEAVARKSADTSKKFLADVDLATVPTDRMTHELFRAWSTLRHTAFKAKPIDTPAKVQGAK